MNCWAISRRVDEARASRFEIKSRRAVSADLLLHQAGGGGKRHVGRDRGDDDEIDLFGGDAGLFHRPPRRLGRQIGGKFVLGAAMCRSFDAGAGGDPFVGGVHHFFEVGIGEDLCRHIGSDAGDGTGAARKLYLARGFLNLGLGAGIMLRRAKVFGLTSKEARGG